MNINFWRVASYALTALSFGGAIVALLMDTNVLGWASLFTTGLVWTRMEWMLAAMAASSNKGDSGYEP